jgi:lysophospholipase L1-like esterase
VTEPLPSPIPVVAIALLLGVVLLVAARRARAGRVLRGTLLMLASLLLLAGVLESLAYLFGDHSDDNNRTFASRLWHERHWKPINSLGFRDVEHMGEDHAGKRVLFVVGDSFMAGQGIDDPADRCVDLLREQLGEGWSVILVAKPGWHTLNEVEAVDGVIEQFGVRPDAVVLAYVLNDIVYPEALAASAGLPTIPPPDQLPETGLWARAARRSYLVNDLAWQLVLDSAGSGGQQGYWEAIAATYAEPAVWERHAEDLHALVDRCRALGARLTVLVFPNLSDIGMTREATARVAGFFEEQGADAIDLSERFTRSKGTAITVSAQDGHPSRAVHRLLAEMLFPRIESPDADG